MLLWPALKVLMALDAPSRFAVLSRFGHQNMFADLCDGIKRSQA
jgi:hypothetical protein